MVRHGQFTNMYTDSDPSLFKRLATSKADIILLGHTHYPLLKRLEKDRILVNPGSVGQARDKGGFASWCIYDEGSSNFQFQRTPYDVGPLLKNARQLTQLSLIYNALY